MFTDCLNHIRLFSINNHTHSSRFYLNCLFRKKFELYLTLEPFYFLSTEYFIVNAEFNIFPK